jgi:hypothetical protein
MSLPGPLTYEAKRFGSDREAPAKRAMRPYADRLKMSEELVRKAPLRHGSWADSGLMAAQVALFVGAVLPLLWAIPGFGSLFGPVEGWLGPMGPSASAMLAAGWWGALLIVVAGTAGVFIMRTAAWKAGSASGEVRFLKALIMAADLAGASLILLALAPAGAGGAAVGGALVMLAMLLALFGAYCTARRQRWLAAVAGALAVLFLTSLVLGALALLLLMWGARAFPGQEVARHPWKRTEVALEPIEPASGLEPDPAGAHVRVRRPLPQGLFIAKVSLVFGAFGPFVLALPWFGVALFGPLILALFPLSLPLIWAAASLQASFIILYDTTAYGALVPGALFTVVWLLIVPAAGGLLGARAVGHRRRPWAAVAGAILLIVGGRLLFGVAALIAIGYAWQLFDGGHDARQQADAQGPAAH